MVNFLITVTVFDDRAMMAWSLMKNGEVSPIQHVGRASITSWMNTFSSILETDRVRISVVDRQTCAACNTPTSNYYCDLHARLADAGYDRMAR